METNKTNTEKEISKDLVYDTPDNAFFNNPEIELKIFQEYLSDYQKISDDILNKMCQREFEADPCEYVREHEPKLVGLQKETIKLNNLKTQHKIEINEFQKRIQSNKQELEDIKEETEGYIAQNLILSEEANSYRQKIRTTFEAHKIASNYFKKNLDIYIETEKTEKSVTLNVYFFTSKPVEKNYFITLRQTNDSWSLESTTPRLPDEDFHFLQNKLQATNNLCVLVNTIRKRFLTMRAK